MHIYGGDSTESKHALLHASATKAPVQVCIKRRVAPAALIDQVVTRMHVKCFRKQFSPSFLLAARG
jgi:hypothetical protein